MARRLIGLDIGTNAVTIAEVTAGNPPRLDMFAQVALPRDAMREGEVADEAAVTDAVARLRTEVGLKKVPVRVGIASPRVVVRQVEMPVMTRDELKSALQFQAGDLIPIPIEDAVLDFAILGTSTADPDSGAEPTMQVLLVAAYEATVAKLVSAVKAGGLEVCAVDLIPLALTRALARPVPAMAPATGGSVAVDESVGAEGIVSFGGGVTAIAVHENGVPQFVRVLGSGGRELTDAIATDLGVSAEEAETLKRALADPATDEMVARARTSVDRPLSVLLDEVRSSIDYYRNQPGSAQLRRVVVTGGSAQLPGLPERLSALVGVPVEPAYMHDLLRIGDIGFATDELPRLEPYLPAPVGLALGGANVGTVIDLLPRHRGGSTRREPASTSASSPRRRWPGWSCWPASRTSRTMINRARSPRRQPRRRPSRSCVRSSSRSSRPRSGVQAPRPRRRSRRTSRPCSARTWRGRRSSPTSARSCRPASTSRRSRARTRFQSPRRRRVARPEPRRPRPVQPVRPARPARPAREPRTRGQFQHPVRRGVGTGRDGGHERSRAQSHVRVRAAGLATQRHRPHGVVGDDRASAKRHRGHVHGDGDARIDGARAPSGELL